MKFRTFLLCTVLACSTAHAASEASYTVQDLYSACTDNDDAARLSCIYYVLGWQNGFITGLTGIAVALDENPVGEALAPVVGICLPSGWTVGQGEAVFVKWAGDNPNQWHIPASAGLVLSYREAFPCSEKGIGRDD